LKKLIYILVFLFVSVSTYAQPSNAKVETIAGKEYYIHYVKKGETLSRIAKNYKASLADVLNNPGKEDRIDIGDKIKIPITTRNKPKNNNNVVNTIPKNTDKKIIEHKIEKGETIYGIAKKYKTTQDEIFELNPEAKNGISPGQVLKISTSENVESNNVVINSKPEEIKVSFDHVVLPQETFFSLSRKYNISQDSIKLLNNGLPDGLKSGSVIHLMVLPSHLELFKSWELNPVVLNNNNQNANNTVKPDSVASTIPVSVFKTGKKDVYNIGLMLPFMLDKNKATLEEADQKNRLSLYEPTRQSLDFYHGVLMALDSLKKAGLNTNLKVFDVGKDSAALKKVFTTAEFKNLDLLIGPFEWIELTAKAAKENKIPMLIPVACSNKVLLDNPFAFKSITTSNVIADETSRFIIKNYKNDNIILIDGKGRNDVGVQKSYKKYLNKYYFEQTSNKDSVKTMQADILASSTITNMLRKDKVNVLVIPSNEMPFVTTALSNLNKFLSRHYNKDYKVVVFGTDEWVKWDQMDITHKLRANVHVPSPTFVDYDTLQTQQLTRAFRNRYKTDPDKYAMMGFDLTWFWMAGYTQYGLDFANTVQQFDITMNQTRFAFVKMNETSGCLNKNVYILKYENYKLIPQKND
jgi:LysM repeat protein/ABC-type branched-subunit amino acid transport system substrate-binding protein